jgi:hypothetical protein
MPKSVRTSQTSARRLEPGRRDRPPTPTQGHSALPISRRTSISARNGKVTNAPPGTQICKGRRTSGLSALAAMWHAAGKSPAEVRKLLAKTNASRCQPPLKSSQLDRIGADLTGTRNNDLPTLVAEAVLEQHFKGGAFLQAYQGQFLHFSETEWRPISEDHLKKLVLVTLAAFTSEKAIRTASVMAEVVMILRATQVADGDPFFDASPPPPIINCLNYEVHLGPDGKTKTKKHRPNSGQRHTLYLEQPERRVRRRLLMQRRSISQAIRRHSTEARRIMG